MVDIVLLDSSGFISTRGIHGMFSAAEDVDMAS